jgi:SAM-dependent methyltransferase
MSGPSAAEFDTFAERYAEHLRNPVRDRFAADPGYFVARKLELILREHQRQGIAAAGRAWLDLGCGQGDLLRLGRGHFARVAGCDVSGAMLAACPELPTRVQPEPSVLPFADASFDLLTAVCVYHHVAPAERAALTASAARVLRPGGWFCMVEHNPLNPVTQWMVSRIAIDADARLLSARRARALLREAGLVPFATRFFLIFPERLHERLGAVERAVEGLPLGGQYAVFARRPGPTG